VRLASKGVGRRASGHVPGAGIDETRNAADRRRSLGGSWGGGSAAGLRALGGGLAFGKRSGRVHAARFETGDVRSHISAER
jgi:hypothetical protein